MAIEGTVGTPVRAWTAFALETADAYAAGFAPDVVVETASTPILGAAAVRATMRTASPGPESLRFPEQVSRGPQTYIDWEARTSDGVPLHGVIVMTLDDEGRVTHLALCQRPLQALLPSATGEREPCTPRGSPTSGRTTTTRPAPP
ncbi:nuclear transport factor 2 family protein [Nocardia sp. NPDC055321]